MNFKFKNTIFTKLVASASILGIIFLIIVIAVLPRAVNGIFEEYLFLALENLSSSQVEVVNQYFDGKKYRVADFSSDGFIRDGFESLINGDGKISEEELYQHLIENKQTLDEYILGIALIDLEGKILSSTDKSLIGETVEDEDYFTESELRGYGSTSVNFITSTLIFSEDQNANQAMAISTPLKDRNLEKDLGVIAIFFDNSEFRALIDRINIDSGTSLEQNEYFYLIDNSGNLIYYSGDTTVSKDHVVVNYPNYFQCEKELSRSDTYVNFDLKRVHASYRCIPEYEWIGIAEVESAQIFGRIDRISNTVIVGISVLLGLAILIFGGIVKLFVSRRVVKINEAMHELNSNNLNITLEDSSSDEIGELARGVISVAKTIDNSFDRNEIRLQNKTKELEDTIRKMQDNNKDLKDSRAALFNVMDDIEDERNKAEELSEDLKKFELAVENVSTHIVFTDENGVILYCNQAVQMTTGYSREEIIGNTPSLWGGQMEKSFYDKMWSTIKNEKKSFSGEIQNKRKDGELYDAKVLITPILDSKGNVRFFVGLEEDISKEKQVDKMKTEFVSLASHQLKTPLSAINWYTESLLDATEQLNEEQREFLQEIYNGSKRMVSLVNALLNVSRIDMGTFSIDPVPTSISKIADSVIKEVQARFESEAHTISKDYDEIPEIPLDPNLTRIIFQNLITNAVKYSPEGTDINVSIKTEGSHLVIKVQDHGYGIPKEQQDKIFEKLFRADNIRDKEADGTGLGLYIVKSIIDNCNGSITFESAENEGTTFIVKLPIEGMTKKEGTKDLTA